VDYLGGLRNPDDHEVVTYVVLVLSGMQQLGNSMEWQSAYVKSLLCFMQPEQPHRVRHALRVVRETRNSHFPTVTLRDRKCVLTVLAVHV
jgi:hypothetical protein